ncbi:hypothetical protein CEP52_016480 [Fusarium oligoseptatum]|uniref:Uncharacterized protein n=1 Tax=Fusarium oligoseptatum TaxID=2604345 RepID=A0A428S359_9HYPO|nr:hypothetical protein CEP52_016480 [Fusarium oligoseptatum]
MVTPNLKDGNLENVPSNISDFSNPESTAFHRAHPDQQANFNRKMNETAAEFYELAFSVHMPQCKTLLRLLIPKLQPYVTAPAQAQAQAQAQAHTINPTVSATVPTPITPQYTHEQAEAEREWVSVGGQWQEAFKRLSMLEIQYRSAEAPQLIAAGVRPDPSKLLSHDGSQQK